MVDVDQRQAKRVAALAAARERYKARLQEVAEIESDSPDIALENRADAFLGTGGSPLRIPIYKVDPAMAALCKTGGPQWIVVTWTAQLNDPTIKRLHDAVINNFNFEYVYNYFFAPEKVKGQVVCAAAQSGGDGAGRDDRGVSVEQGARGRSQRVLLR